MVYELGEDYDYAFASGMNKVLLWFLSRIATVPISLVKRFKTQAIADGYDMVFDVQREELP